MTTQEKTQPTPTVQPAVQPTVQPSTQPAMQVATPGDILEFWFGEIRDGWTTTDRGGLWFRDGAKNDPEIIRRFGATVAGAGRGELDGWMSDWRGALALIIALDQFTRCVHRGSAKAFSNDARATAHCESAIARGLDSEAELVHRQFFYMPLMHGEDLRRQERCVELFESLAKSFPPERAETAKNILFHAREHRDLIAKFARFPHRNAILGRDSTPEESAYLSENANKTYGQSPTK